MKGIVMYSPRITKSHIEKLFRLKEGFKSLGERVTMVDIVKEALERYLPIKEEELRQKVGIEEQEQS